MNAESSKLKMPLLVLGAILLLVACLWVLRAALAPFFASVVFTYLLWPMFSRLSKRMGKVLSALIVVSGGLVFSIAAIWTVVVVFEGQVKHIIASFPRWRVALETKLLPWLQDNPWITEKLQLAADSFDPMIFVRGVSDAGLGVLGWVLQILSFALLPLIAYYMLVDGSGWLKSLYSLIPDRFRADVRDVLGEINTRLGGFIRGEMMVIVAMSILQGVAFAILGVPYAWLLGLIAGVSNIVPYSPYATALPLALIMTAIEGGANWSHIIVIALTFFVVQKAEGFYFTPVWVGKASKLHPLEVLLALICFGFAFGVLGLIFAVPLMIVLKVLAEKLLNLYRTHPWFEQQNMN